MRKENECIELPESSFREKARWFGPWQNTLFYGAAGTVIGTLFSMVLGGHRREVFLNRAIKEGIHTGAWTAVLGYFMGERNVTEHSLTVENTKLKHQVHELKAESGKPETDKSFVQQVSEKDAGCGCKLRS